ncbi:MAG: hypothetical protein ABJH04_15600 [Cyclobacteriaceae bacterium]
MPSRSPLGLDAAAIVVAVMLSYRAKVRGAGEASLAVLITANYTTHLKH